jgi:hypothetical protein
MKRMMFALVLLGTSAIGAHAQVDPGGYFFVPAVAGQRHSSLTASAVIDIAPDSNSGMTPRPAFRARNRLVIDSASFCIQPTAPGGVAFGIVKVVAGGTPVSLYVALNKLVDTTNNTETWIGNFSTALSADPGTSIGLVVYRDALGVPSSGHYTLIGHYVPAP